MTNHVPRANLMGAPLRINGISPTMKPASALTVERLFEVAEDVIDRSESYPRLNSGHGEIVRDDGSKILLKAHEENRFKAEQSPEEIEFAALAVFGVQRHRAWVYRPQDRKLHGIYAITSDIFVPQWSKKARIRNHFTQVFSLGKPHSGSEVLLATEDDVRQTVKEIEEAKAEDLQRLASML